MKKLLRSALTDGFTEVVPEPPDPQPDPEPEPRPKPGGDEDKQA
jgi:hypothetical protein